MRGIVGRSALALLLYRTGSYSVHAGTVLDYAHVVKNLMHQLVNTFAGTNGPSGRKQKANRCDDLHKLLQSLTGSEDAKGASLECKALLNGGQAGVEVWVQSLGIQTDWKVGQFDALINDAVYKELVSETVRVGITTPEKTKVRKLIHSQVRWFRKKATDGVATAAVTAEVTAAHKKLKLTPQVIDLITIRKSMMLNCIHINDPNRRLFTKGVKRGAVSELPNMSRLKMHCLVQLVKYFGHYLFDDTGVSSDIHTAVLGLMDAMAVLGRREWPMWELVPFEVLLLETICLYELYMPLNHRVIMLHCLYELYLCIKRNGPASEFWGFGLERWVQSVSLKCTSTVNPAKTIGAQYVLSANASLALLQLDQRAELLRLINDMKRKAGNGLGELINAVEDAQIQPWSVNRPNDAVTLPFRPSEYRPWDGKAGHSDLKRQFPRGFEPFQSQSLQSKSLYFSVRVGSFYDGSI